jgi:hypothetical protein
MDFSTDFPRNSLSPAVLRVTPWPVPRRVTGKVARFGPRGFGFIESHELDRAAWFLRCRRRQVHHGYQDLVSHLSPGDRRRFFIAMKQLDVLLGKGLE